MAHPSLPSIDLVDMPGLRTAPLEAARATREVYEQHLARHAHTSIFLVVVKATGRPNADKALEFVVEHNLQARPNPRSLP